MDHGRWRVPGGLPAVNPWPGAPVDSAGRQPDPLERLSGRREWGEAQSPLRPLRAGSQWGLNRNVAGQVYLERYEFGVPSSLGCQTEGYSIPAFPEDLPSLPWPIGDGPWRVHTDAGRLPVPRRVDSGWRWLIDSLGMATRVAVRSASPPLRRSASLPLRLPARNPNTSRPRTICGGDSPASSRARHSGGARDPSDPHQRPTIDPP